MTSVMLGGSRKLQALPPAVKERLTEWMDSSAWFLLGDAPGIDFAFQQSLSTHRYSRVVIFTSLPNARNNLGNWECRPIESGLKSRGAAMHTVKDRKMVQLADTGLMVWDGESPGTLANVIDFVDSGKDCLIYMPQGSEIWRVDSQKNRDSLIEQYPQVAAESLKRLATYKKRMDKSQINSEKTLFD